MKYTFKQIEFISDSSEKIAETVDVLDAVKRSEEETFYLRSPEIGVFELSRRELIDVLIQRRNASLNRLAAMGIDIEING